LHITINYFLFKIIFSRAYFKSIYYTEREIEGELYNQIEIYLSSLLSNLVLI
jgi:hypothetical protein